MNPIKHDFPIDYINSLMKLTKEQALEYLNARGFNVKETSKFYFVTREGQTDHTDNRDFAVLHVLGIGTSCVHYGLNSSFKVRIPK